MTDGEQNSRLCPPHRVALAGSHRIEPETPWRPTKITQACSQVNCGSIPSNCFRMCLLQQRDEKQVPSSDIFRKPCGKESTFLFSFSLESIFFLSPRELLICWDASCPSEHSVACCVPCLHPGPRNANTCRHQWSRGQSLGNPSYWDPPGRAAFGSGCRWRALSHLALGRLSEGN